MVATPVITFSVEEMKFIMHRLQETSGEFGINLISSIIRGNLKAAEPCSGKWIREQIERVCACMCGCVYVYVCVVAAVASQLTR